MLGVVVLSGALWRLGKASRQRGLTPHWPAHLFPSHSLLFGMKVLKFGGTSVRDADRIRVVARLVEEQPRAPLTTILLVAAVLIGIGALPQGCG